MTNVSESTRVSSKQVLKDIESYHAFATMTDYRANNAANSREADAAAHEILRAAEQHAVTTHAAASAVVDALTIARRDFHGVILGIKNEARALYGPRSDQVAALGLKKKSDQGKRPKAKKAPAGV